MVVRLVDVVFVDVGQLLDVVQTKLMEEGVGLMQEKVFRAFETLSKSQIVSSSSFSCRDSDALNEKDLPGLG